MYLFPYYIFINIVMSIYGGFPTRQLQANYNHALFSLIQLLQHRVHDALAREFQTDDYQFMKNLEKGCKKLIQLEQNKHLEPKFSKACEPILKFLQDGDQYNQPLQRGSVYTASQRTRKLTPVQKRSRQELSQRNKSRQESGFRCERRTLQQPNRLKDNSNDLSLIKQEKVKRIVYVSGPSQKQRHRPGSREKMLSAGVRGTSMNVRFEKDQLLSRLVNQPRRKKSMKHWRKRLNGKRSRDALIGCQGQWQLNVFLSSQDKEILSLQEQIRAFHRQPSKLIRKIYSQHLNVKMSVYNQHKINLALEKSLDQKLHSVILIEREREELVTIKKQVSQQYKIAKQDLNELKSNLRESNILITQLQSHILSHHTVLKQSTEIQQSYFLSLSKQQKIIKEKTKQKSKYCTLYQKKEQEIRQLKQRLLVVKRRVDGKRKLVQEQDQAINCEKGKLEWLKEELELYQDEIQKLSQIQTITQEEIGRLKSYLGRGVGNQQCRDLKLYRLNYNLSHQNSIAETLSQKNLSLLNHLHELDTQMSYLEQNQVELQNFLEKKRRQKARLKDYQQSLRDENIRLVELSQKYLKIDIAAIRMFHRINKMPDIRQRVYKQP